LPIFRDAAADRFVEAGDIRPDALLLHEGRSCSASDPPVGHLAFVCLVSDVKALRAPLARRFRGTFISRAPVRRRGMALEFLAFPLVLFFPGYTLVNVLFPRKGE